MSVSLHLHLKSVNLIKFRISNCSMSFVLVNFNKGIQILSVVSVANKMVFKNIKSIDLKRPIIVWTGYFRLCIIGS